MSLLGILDHSLLGKRDQVALEADTPEGVTRSYTFGELEARSNRLAHILLAKGIISGDRVAFLLPNRVEIIDLWLACLKLGVIAVPINVLYQAREIAHIVGDAAPTAVVTTSARFAELPTGITCWDVESLQEVTLSVHEPIGRSYVVPQPSLYADSPMALVYTSGTTGASKGAVLTHGNFVSNAVVLNAAWGMREEDRLLCALPLFHVHGLGNALHCWLAVGCHMKLVARFDITRSEAWFTDYAPTVFFGVPTMYVRLLQLDASIARGIGSHTRLFVCGSAPLPAHVLDAFRERYGHVILERYGMTETLMNVSNPYYGERRAGTIGLPLALTAVRIVDERGVDVENGVSGELWVRGPNVCVGYWRRPAETADAFTDGWFHTGDIGVRAVDGYITLVGRRSDLIISGGFNIYPREIEELLMEVPGVREAAVVGVADSARGEVPVAYLVSDEEINATELSSLIKTQLASFKVPRAFVRVDALPRTALGKVQKHLLPPVP